MNTLHGSYTVVFVGNVLFYFVGSPCYCVQTSAYFHPCISAHPQIGQVWKYWKWKPKTKSLVDLFPNGIATSKWRCKNFIFSMLLLLWYMNLTIKLWPSLQPSTLCLLGLFYLYFIILYVWKQWTGRRPLLHLQQQPNYVLFLCTVSKYDPSFNVFAIQKEAGCFEFDSNDLKFFGSIYVLICSFGCQIW